MPNNPEMSKFLYTIVKQLDLKSIDWNQVSSELGITNGHAARMRYSRFKQQMEGNAPVRRTRNPNSKRASRNKRPKEEDSKNPRAIKPEESPSMADQMHASSPSVASFDASQESLLQPMPETIVKSEPREEQVYHSVSPEIPLAVPAASYGRPEMPLHTMTLPSQIQQLEGIHHGPPSHEHVPEFSYDTSQPQTQHQRPLYQMMPQVYGMMGQTLGSDMMMAEQRDYDTFLTMETYNHISDVGCHGHMMPGMVKIEERWDASYGQT